MAIDFSIKVVPTLEKPDDFVGMLFGIANLVVDDSRAFEQHGGVELAEVQLH